MPRGFTSKEKKKIKELLINKGEKLFSRYGLKKTSIKDLTKSVGIAQGSFYKFFSSKEELYFEIVEQNEREIKNKLLSEDIQKGKVNKKMFHDFLKKAMELIEEYPLIKNMYNSDEYQQMLSKLPEEKINEHIGNDTDTLAPLLKSWQKGGYIKNYDIDAISGVLRALFLLTLHKKEIGEEHFDKTIELFIDLISEGLIADH
ncbi:MAG: TetR/AcrR family transcriptional regulator [Bacillota bacterium]